MTAGRQAGADPGDHLVRVLTCDLGGISRVRAVLESQRNRWLAHGCGWVPSSIAISPLGYIVEGEPFGTVGDLRLMPDPVTEVSLPAIGDQPPTSLMLGSLVQMDGERWDCCPRGLLAKAESDLLTETGLSVRAAVEQEFTLPVEQSSPPLSHEALLRNGPFGWTLLRILADGGLEPETWLPEYGRDQWEITVSPSSATVAADRAVLVREVVRHVAHALGRAVTFTPMPFPDSVGNGVHVHLSLVDDGASIMLEPGTRRLSDVAGSFAAGILEHAAALVAMTCPSPPSYERLRPGMWSASHAYLGAADRGALLRLCTPFDGGGPSAQDQINLEFRAVDASANPSVVLAMLIRAGLDGIRRGLPAPVPLAAPPESGSHPPQQPPRLPDSLATAIDALNDDPVAISWLPPNLRTTYLAIKKDELECTAGMSRVDLLARYSRIY
jgi:glutamine synthetase